MYKAFPTKYYMFFLFIFNNLLSVNFGITCIYTIYIDADVAKFRM